MIPILLQNRKLAYLLGGLVFCILGLLLAQLALAHWSRSSAERELLTIPPVAPEFWDYPGADPARQMQQVLDAAGEPTQKISQLDGRRYPAELTEQVVGVMIENHSASRPQMQGLPQASLVYETLAEGGITRFLAIFGYQDLKKVGPVRSARPYFVDWASEFCVALVHAGGSDAALSQLATSGLLDFDEDGELLYRDFSFVKPHNLFADLGSIKSAAAAKATALLAPANPVFDFSGAIPESAIPSERLTLDFSTASYRAEFVYDPVAGDYQRYLAGELHTDALGQPVRPRNLIVQFTEYQVLDEAGRLRLRTGGTGVAWYFSAGKSWQGSWSRLAAGPTRYLNALGQPISLQPGQTWIAVIDSGKATRHAELGMKNDK